MVELHHKSCARCGKPFDHELLDFLSCELNECYACTMADEPDAYRRLREKRQQERFSGLRMPTKAIQ
jgi:hypothetical protein